MNSPQNSETADTPAPEAPVNPCELHPWSTLNAQGTCFRCETDALAKADQVEAERQRLADKVKRKQEEIEARVGAAGIPLRYLEYTFDTFPLTDPLPRAVTILRSYANRWQSVRPRGISGLLVGGAGTGKTGLALCVAHAVMRSEGATVAFMSAYGAVRHQRDTWGRRGRTEREALDDLLAPDLLILDDVGTSVGSDAEVSMLFEVLNGRYQERRPTFLTSNLPMDDYEVNGQKRPGLKTYLGPRVVDRFRDDGSFTLTFDWPSLRGKQQ
ncbi:MAG: ATP-binding protein [Lysobacter sp.]